MTRIDFDREKRTATFNGITVTGPDPYFDLCRVLTDTGHPDGPATFHDERGLACLTVRSIHACARRYRPTDAEKAARAARRAEEASQGGKDGEAVSEPLAPRGEGKESE